MKSATLDNQPFNFAKLKSKVIAKVHVLSKHLNEVKHWTPPTAADFLNNANCLSQQMDIASI